MSALIKNFSQIKSILLFILILANAYFAAAEIAFISLNDAKLDMQVKEGNKKAKSIKKILDNPSKFLATIQIGITLAGFLSSAFASEAFASELAPVLYGWIPYLSLEAWNSISIVLITIVLSYFTLILGELVPKRIAMKYYEKIAFGSVGVIKTIATFTAPFVKFLTFSTNVVSKLFGVSETEEETVTEEEVLPEENLPEVTYAEASSAEELEDALFGGAEEILITSDFEIDRTF